jgi:uncharacterized OB-fold protein
MGTVFSYTWADSRAIPEQPLYNVSVIELEGTEGAPVRLMTQVIGVGKEDLYVDLPVEVAFVPLDDEVAVPMFRPKS